MFNRRPAPNRRHKTTSKKCDSKCKPKSRWRKLSLESLEERRVFALLGVGPLIESPFTDYANGAVSYNNATQDFKLTALPTSFFYETAPMVYDGGSLLNGHLEINIKVDNTGALIGGVAGDDFVISGDVDVNGDTIVDFSGVLVTGEVTGFGFQDSGIAVDDYDFRFTATGGLLASYFTGKDIAVATTSENSNFVGLFTQSISGNAKGIAGGIPKPVGGELASLSGNKYKDLTGNGISGDDSGLAGITIQLTYDSDNDGDFSDEVAAPLTTVTGAGGEYSFLGLTPGKYKVEEIVPLGYTPTTPISYIVELSDGEHADTGFDFANAENGKIEGHKTLEFLECKCDKYGNPIQTVVTQDQAGVTIKLYKDDGDSIFEPGSGDVYVDSTVTDANGNYSFQDLAFGNYFVQEVVDTGYVAVTDPDVLVTVTPGATTSNVNFKNKLVKGSIGNYFFIDYNSNGIQDTGDEGVNGLTVKLLDKSGNVVATTVTASDGSGNAGYYLFYNLDAGQYFVEFVVPTGVTFTTKDISSNSNDALDSDANANGRTDIITLAANQHIRTIDAGVKGEVCVENIVYKVKDYFDKCQQSKAGTIKGVTLEYNDGTDELYVQVTVAAYNGKIADGFTIVIDDGNSIGDKAGTHAVFYFDATGASPVLNVLAYNGDQSGSSIRDSNGVTSTYDPDRVATSLKNESGWVKELTATGNSSKKVFTFRVDVGAINDHVPIRKINWQGAEIGKYASFLVDTYAGLSTKYDANGFLTKWSFNCHGWMDACQIKTQKCTVKECIPIDEFFAEWGWTTSAFNGNSDGDPLSDWDWDGSKAAACKCDDGHDPCKPRNDCKDDHWDDWDCFKDFGRKLYGRC